MPAAVIRLARLQAGVVSREQALGNGMTDAGISRMKETGVWQSMTRGVYFTASMDPPWLASAWAGLLVGGDAARLGGEASAHLAGFCPEAPSTIEVLLPASGPRPTVTGPWLFHRERVGVRSAECCGSPPRLRVEDTVLDLVAAARDAKTVVHWVTAAVQGRSVTADQLRRAAARRQRLANRRLLNQLLADVAVGARSPLEVRYLHDVERAHGLPDGDRQIGRRGTEVDVWYEQFALLVELDGRLRHEGVGRFRDMHRDNSALLDGLSTLRFGYADVRDAPCEVAFQVAAILASRGWPGPVDRCRSCLRVA